MIYSKCKFQIDWSIKDTKIYLNLFRDGKNIEVKIKSQDFKEGEIIEKELFHLVDWEGYLRKDKIYGDKWEEDGIYGEIYLVS